MACEIHKNDIGTIFKFTLKDCDNIVVDISGATTKNILFTKPTGVLLTKAGTFTTNGTDGLLQYTTLSGDLDVLGVWQAQAMIVLANGTWRSDVVRFIVHRNLD